MSGFYPCVTARANKARQRTELLHFGFGTSRLRVLYRGQDISKDFSQLCIYIRPGLHNIVSWPWGQNRISAKNAAFRKKLFAVQIFEQS